MTHLAPELVGQPLRLDARRRVGVQAAVHNPIPKIWIIYLQIWEGHSQATLFWDTTPDMGIALLPSLPLSIEDADRKSTAARRNEESLLWELNSWIG